MEVLQIDPGLWVWSAPHPDWRGATHWPEDVNCVYYEASDSTVLVDPLVPAADEDRFWEALDRDVERLGRPVTVLLTAPADREAFDASLRGLLELPVAHVLVAHGEPVLHEGRAKIEEALARG